MFETLKNEWIADSIHLSPQMIQLIYKNIGRNRLILVTDARWAKCLNPGYDLLVVKMSK